MARLADACVLGIKNGSCSVYNLSRRSGAQVPKKDVPELDPDIRSSFQGNFYIQGIQQFERF